MPYDLGFNLIQDHILSAPCHTPFASQRPLIFGELSQPSCGKYWWISLVHENLRASVTTGKPLVRVAVAGPTLLGANEAMQQYFVIEEAAALGH